VFYFSLQSSAVNLQVHCELIQVSEGSMQEWT